MLELQQKGAHNINLVTPTHYAPSVKEAVRIAGERNLHLPIVYNTSSYDSIHTIMGLNETVDVYLADLKYVTEKSARELSFAENYPSAAKAAIAEMVKQKGSAVVENGIMRSGVIVRILLLPGKVAEAKLALSYILSEYGDDVYVSLMSQYTPMPNMKPPLDRRVTKREYGELCDYALKKGLQNGFIQEGGAASESFIPPFDMSGI
jgi:putative pyruvate formate lyase activating enzyme